MSSRGRDREVFERVFGKYDGTARYASFSGGNVLSKDEISLVVDVVVRVFEDIDEFPNQRLAKIASDVVRQFRDRGFLSLKQVKLLLNFIRSVANDDIREYAISYLAPRLPDMWRIFIEDIFSDYEDKMFLEG